MATRRGDFRKQLKQFFNHLNQCIFKKKIFCLIAFYGGIQLFSSCQHKEIGISSVSNEVGNKNELAVIDGILHFNSAEACEKLLATLGNSEKIERFTKQNSGFRSMFVIYNELISKDLGELIKDGGISNYEGAFKVSVDKNGDKVYDRAILDESIAAVVNKEGLVQIGDTLYKIGEEKTLKMHVGYKNESFTVDNPHVIGKEVLHQTVKMSPPKNAKVSSDHNFADLEYNPGAGFNNRRFRIMGWSTN